MKIENRKNAQKIKLIFFAIPFLFVLTVVPLLIFDVDEGFELIVSIAILIALIYLTINGIDYNYLNIEIDKNKVVFKYFGLAPINKQFRTFQLKSREFRDYKIEKKMLGLKEMLTVYRSDEGEVYKYPQVNINALNKKDRAQLVKALELLKKINN